MNSKDEKQKIKNKLNEFIELNSVEIEKLSDDDLKNFHSEIKKRKIILDKLNQLGGLEDE